MKYQEIYQYWNTNPCSGGNPTFPFFLFRNKKVLEIGCGVGNDALRFVKEKAIYTGIDLTEQSIFLTQAKIGNQGQVKVMNAEFMDFPDNYFDMIYSWGVIHHAVEPKKIINDAYRVLKPGGHICVMLYGKPSFKYFEIIVLRKILWYLHFYRYNEIRKKTPHPTTEQWISWNTDNLGCPLARVYTKKQAVNLLEKFKVTQTWTKENGWFRILIARKDSIT